MSTTASKRAPRPCKHPRRRQQRDRTREAWKQMWQRCTNPNSPRWAQYGGRGIKVCKRWRSFEAFRDDLGLCPYGWELDRRNVDEGYTPANTRWIPRFTGSRTSDVLITLELPGLRIVEGRVPELADLFEIKPSTLYSRLRRGVGAAELIAPPRGSRHGPGPAQ